MTFARSTSTTAAALALRSVLVELRREAFQVNLAVALGELIEHGLLNILPSANSSDWFDALLERTFSRELLERAWIRAAVRAEVRLVAQRRRAGFDL